MELYEGYAADFRPIFRVCLEDCLFEGYLLENVTMRYGCPHLSDDRRIMAPGSQSPQYHSSYPHDGTYADLLWWHLKVWGTRPDGNTKTSGSRWRSNEFLKAAFGDTQPTLRTLANWLGAGNPPDDTNAAFVSHALFGTETKFDDWRTDLELARARSRKGANSLNINNVNNKSDGNASHRSADMARTGHDEIHSNSVSRRYQQFISKFLPSAPTLPLVHTCYGNSVNRLLDNRTILPIGVDQFLDKWASFFFYGSPRYRSNSTGTFSRSNQSALFSFIFNYNELTAGDGILPFDSTTFGAHQHLAGDTSIAEFYIPGTIEYPGKFVTAFFGSNKSYLERRVRDGILEEISPFDFHSRSYFDILKAGADHLIEIHYSGPIVLTKENLLAVIAPAWACEYESFVSFAQEMDAELLPYNFEFDSKDEVIEIIKEAAHEWLARRGFASG